jgi:hypothetical protein
MKKLSNLFILNLFVLILLFANTSNVFAVEWQKMETSHFLIFHKDLKLAVEAKRIAESSYKRLVSELSFKPNKKIKIYLYSNQKEYLAINPPEETVGFAEPSSNQIFLSTEITNMETTIPHEITHIIFIQSIPEISRVPFWFNEGLAIFESNSPYYPEGEKKLFSERNADSISQLSRLISAPVDIDTRKRISFEGYLIIKFISERYGANKLRMIITNLQHRVSFEKALEESLGVTVSELDGSWYKYVNREKNLVFLSDLRYFGWTILSVVVIVSTIVWIVRWRRRFELYQEDEHEFFEGENKG